MIASGSVRVNGTTAQIGDRVNPGKDRVTVNGRLVQKVARQVYFNGV